MAKNSIRDYDATSGNNTDVQSVDISEGCAASGINNALREIMTDLKNVSTGAVALETPGADQLNVDNIRIDGNTISSTDTNGDITLDPDGTGNVVVKTAASGGTPQSDAGLVLEGTDASRCDFQILGDDGAFQSIYFGDASDADIGSIAYSHSGNNMRFTANAAERMRIDSSGFVGIGESTPRKMLHITKNDSDGVIILDADGVTTDHQIVFSKDYGTGGTTGGNYWGIGVDGSENRLVFAYDANSQASLAADSKMILDSSGRIYFNTTTNFVGQGNTSTGQMFQTEGTAYFSRASGYSLGLNRNGDGELTNFSRSGSFVGSINVTSSSTSYNTSSDYRLKENVADMTGAIDRVKALAPKRFNFIVDADTTVDGFLAHEAQTVVPEAISGSHNEVDEDGNAVMQGIDQSKLVPLLTGALQEAIAKIETLETQRADLEARLTALENA